MTGDKNVDREIAELSALKLMTRSYGQMAALRMKKMRDSVLYNRGYLEQIRGVFNEVIYEYSRTVGRVIFSGKWFAGKKNITFLAHNGKSVAVFLSANTKRYGELLNETFDLFIEDVKAGSEATVVGSVGENMFIKGGEGRSYTYFDFPDNNMDRETLMKLVRHLVVYEEIHIFYGKYERTSMPKPSKYVMSSNPQREISAAKPSEPFIFEPSVTDVLKFFEKEIFGNLFEQVMRESMLAKFASRLVAMSQAEMKVSQALQKAEVAGLRMVHAKKNRQQLNSLSSILVRG